MAIPPWGGWSWIDLMSATLDTLKLAKRFKDAGASEPLAEAFAEAMRETREADLSHLATKTDLELLEQRLLIKLGGMMVVAVGVVAAFVKLL